MYYHADLLKLMLDFLALPDADERYRIALETCTEEGLGDPCLCLEDVTGKAMFFPFKLFTY